MGNLPTEQVYSETPVSQVIVPGSAGEYGVTAEHVPVVAQLKAGVLQIFHDDSSEPEKYFVPGGFSLTHPNSVTDVSCPEAAKSAYSAAEIGSLAQAEAQVDMDVYRAMGAAVGLNLA